MIQTQVYIGICTRYDNSQDMCQAVKLMSCLPAQLHEPHYRRLFNPATSFQRPPRHRLRAVAVFYYQPTATTYVRIRSREEKVARSVFKTRPTRSQSAQLQNCNNRKMSCFCCSCGGSSSATSGENGSRYPYGPDGGNVTGWYTTMCMGDSSGVENRSWWDKPTRRVQGCPLLSLSSNSNRAVQNYPEMRMLFFSFKF